MTTRKSERLLNLLITLLVTRGYVPKERLRRVVEPYRDLGDEAFEKMFERDKEELRSLGVPVEVGTHDPAFENEPGYRVSRDAFELPEITLSAEEAAVVGLAARVWQHAGLASATSDALVKLTAAGVEVDRDALDQVQPRLNVEEPAFEALWTATLRRTPVAFDYHRAAESAVTERHLEPWGVVCARGRWYAVGLDSDRGEPRLFRLSRIVGEVRTTGRAEAYQVPEDTDIRDLSRSLAPATPDRTAEVLARQGGCVGLRRRARTVAESVPGPDQGAQWDRLEVDFGDVGELVDDLLGYGAEAVVVGPEDVRESVVTRLRAAGGRR